VTRLKGVFQWPLVSLQSGFMVTGQDIRRARERRRLSQEKLAALLEVSSKSVGRWERGETIPKSALGAIESILGLGEQVEGPALSDASDAELLAEVALRLEQRKSRQRRSPPHADQATDTAYYRPRMGASETA
jgi:transcriptional regulator with XRE-family HTH domain